MRKLWFLAVSIAFQPALSRYKGTHPQTLRAALHDAALPISPGFTWAGSHPGARERCIPVALALLVAASARPVAAAVSGADRSSDDPGRQPGRRIRVPARRSKKDGAAVGLGAIRFFAQDRGLQNVEALRSLVMSDLDKWEESLRSRQISRIEMLLVGSFQANEKAFEVLRIMRKTANADSDRLQMTLLRGDPLLYSLGRAWRRVRGRAPADAVDVGAELAEQSEAARWLRGQVGQQGGLDPAVVSSIIARVKLDPDLVERLAHEAKERQGRDAYASALLAGLQEAKRQKAQSWLWGSGRQRVEKD